MQSNVSFAPGNAVLFHDTVYSITGYDQDRREFTLTTEGNVSLRLLESTLHQNFLARVLRAVVPPRTIAPRARADRYQDAWLSARDECREAASCRMRLLKVIDELGLSTKKPSELKRALTVFAAREAERQRCAPSKQGGTPADEEQCVFKASHSTIGRWRARLASHNGHIAGLLPQFDRRGGAGASRLNGEVDEAIAWAIDNFYSTTQRLTRSTTYVELCKHLEYLNEDRDESARLEVPSIQTLDRRIAARNAYKMTCSRAGKAAADTMFRQSWRAPLPAPGLFNKHWQMDHSKLDIFVVDEDGRLIGRPRLTVLIELTTRSVVGFSVGFQTESAETSIEALRSAVLPKDPQELAACDLTREWRCYGLPETVHVDNGSDYHSRDFRTACAQLGIDIEYMPRKAPWAKGAVERFIGSANKQVRKLPGGIIPLHMRKALGVDGEKALKPESLAVLTLSDLNRYLYRWTVDEYTWKPHKTLHGKAPGERWNELATLDRLLVCDKAEVDRACTKATTRTLSATGIQVANVPSFVSQEMGDLRRQYGIHRPIDVEVRYRTAKLDRIWFRIPKTETWVEVLNHDPNTKDLSEAEIAAIAVHRRALEKQGRTLSFKDARDDLCTSILIDSKKSSAQRRRLNRLVGITKSQPPRQPHPPELNEVEDATVISETTSSSTPAPAATSRAQPLSALDRFKDIKPVALDAVPLAADRLGRTSF